MPHEREIARDLPLADLVESGEQLPRPVAWRGGDPPRHIEQPGNPARLLEASHHDPAFSRGRRE